MAQQIEVENYSSLNTANDDKLAADTVAAQAQIQITNTAGFSVGQYVVVGALGTDGCEARIIQSIDDATHLTFTVALSLPHSRFDVVKALNGDEIKVYVAPNVNGLPPDPVSGGFTLLGAPQPIAFNQMVTFVTDPTGSNAFWYGFTYLNSNTGSETNLAESEIIRGGGYNYYCSIYDIRHTAGMLDNQYVTNGDIDAKRLEMQGEVDAALQGMYPVPFQPPINSMISGITRYGAAGKLLMDNPGAAGMSSAIYLQGQDYYRDAVTMLTQIATRKRFITDANGQQTILPSARTSKSWPDETTHNVSPWQGGSHRNFRMADVQEGTRRY